MTERLPPEILLDIFSRLNRRSDKSSCQLVCKSWYGPASECLNKEVELYGYREIRKLYNSLCSNNEQSMSGGMIRKLKFIKQCSTGRPINQQEYLNLLRACPNLQHLEFINVSPVFYLRYMTRSNIVLNQLQNIHYYGYYGLDDHYLSIAANNCNSMRQLCIRTNSIFGSIQRPVEDHLPLYLTQFIQLDRLTISGPISLSITSILGVCPKLSRLSLKGGMSRFITDDKLASAAEGSTYLNLTTLTIETQCLCKAACKFILHRLTRLRVLNVRSSSYSGVSNRNMELIMESFDVFQENLTNRPSINTLVFKNFYNISDDLTHLLPFYFPYLNELGFKDCIFSGLWDAKNNLTLKLGFMDLYKFSIDITSILKRHRQVKRLCIEVILASNKNCEKKESAVYYAREGKLRAHHSFQRKTLKAYASSSAKKKRDDSLNTMVLKIHINTLRILEVYAQNSFTQTLSVTQH